MTVERNGASRRARRLITAVLYWLAVLAVSFALVFLLLSFLESRDRSSIDAGLHQDSAPLSLANTTIRRAAL
jgi:hypothetical protein